MSATGVAKVGGGLFIWKSHLLSRKTKSVRMLRIIQGPGPVAQARPQVGGLPVSPSPFYSPPSSLALKIGLELALTMGWQGKLKWLLASCHVATGF